ncbi:MAG: alpha/beta hydrolase-fold protein [Bacillota bacterium]|nr:alpha/beta hydrolase-fold protein [Bacillota bacterium]
MILKEKRYFPFADSTRRLHIYLPDDYYCTKERYPVMYYFDGHNLFENQEATYGTCWGLKEFHDSWPKKMIIVGIECSHEGNQRLVEYCPYYFPRRFGKGFLGTGRETLKWLVQDVKPYIDTAFRTYSHREATGIAGSSMGGLMALCAISEYNEIFSKAACVSSAIGFCVYQVRKQIRNHTLDSNTRIYMSYGTKESRKKTEYNHSLLVEAFMEQECCVKMYVQENGVHCERDWNKQVSIYMNYLWME